MPTMLLLLTVPLTAAALSAPKPVKPHLLHVIVDGAFPLSMLAHDHAHDP